MKQIFSCVAWPKWLIDLLGLNSETLDAIMMVLYPIGAILLLILWQVDRHRVKKFRSKCGDAPDEAKTTDHLQ